MTLRKDNGLTQEQLANALGISYQAVSKWENGRCLPDVYYLKILADLFHVTEKELLNGERSFKKKEIDINHHSKVLEVTNLSKSFGSRKVLDNINLDLNYGELVFILGASGSGKSTLINIISGNLKSSSGEIWLEDKCISGMSDKELDKCFGNDKLIGWNHDKLFINNYFKMMKTSKNDINSRNNKHLVIDSEDNKNNKKTEITKNENVKNSEKSNAKTINSYTNKKLFLKRPSTGEEKKSPRIIPATERNDIWMPKNFKNYDLLVKNPRMINKKSSQDEMLKRIPSFSTLSREIGQR